MTIPDLHDLVLSEGRPVLFDRLPLAEPAT